MSRPFPAPALPALLQGLALFATACLPPDPFELVDETDGLPPGVCWGFYEQVEEGRWRLDSQIGGSSTTTQPGELAAAELEIRLNDWTSEHLVDMRLELEVVAGQALPGQVLVLQHAGEPLQEVTLGGSHGNVARFDLELSPDLCGSWCTLSLSGPPAPSDVPVPLRLSGKLSASLDATRKTLSCRENQLTVVVTDAP